MRPPSDPMIAGLDEVGRGCLAGPVIAAAVILPDRGLSVAGLADSKTLSANRRLELAEAIRREAVAVSIGRAEPLEIDRLNILEASMLAMRRAFAGLAITPTSALVDGNRYPDLPCPGSAIIGGDGLIPAIAAASIVAKVFRDLEMDVLEQFYPGYGFAVHKGYPTREHRAKVAARGPCPAHRRTFKPVMQVLRDRSPLPPSEFLGAIP